MIEAHGLVKRYGSTVAVSDLSCPIRPGMVIGFLGPNGLGDCRRLQLPGEVIGPVRIMGVLHAGHHHWDRYGGHASGPGTDHWGGT